MLAKRSNSIHALVSYVCKTACKSKEKFSIGIFAELSLSNVRIKKFIFKLSQNANNVE